MEPKGPVFRDPRFCLGVELWCKRIMRSSPLSSISNCKPNKEKIMEINILNFWSGRKIVQLLSCSFLPCPIYILQEHSSMRFTFCILVLDDHEFPFPSMPFLLSFIYTQHNPPSSNRPLNGHDQIVLIEGSTFPQPPRACPSFAVSLVYVVKCRQDTHWSWCVHGNVPPNLLA